MIVQDVTPLPTINPHGGPITHSSTWSIPDSPVHPLFARLFLMRGLVCNSRTTFLVIYFGNTSNTYSRCSGPLSHFVSGNERLPTCLKLPMIPPYFTLDIFLSFNSRVTFCHLPRCYRPDSQPCRGPFFWNTHPLFFCKYDGVLEERMQTSSRWPEEEKWRHQHNGSTSSRRATKTEKNR